MRITWLHLSDLHVSTSVDSEWKAERSAILSDIRDHQTSAGAELPNRAGCMLRPDVIFVTGDLAWSGKTEEYQEVEDFLRELLEITQLTPERLFVVPGNHDVDRSAVEGNGYHTAAVRMLADPSLNPQALNNIAKGFWPLEGPLLAKFDAYTRSQKRLGVKYGSNTSYSVSLEIGGAQIEVLGLNSAWTSFEKDEDTRRVLMLGLPQIDERLSSRNAPALRIGLMHHPRDTLHNADAASALDKLLLNNTCVLLTGHMHDQRIVYEHEPEREHVRFAAGAVYADQSRWSQHAYSYGICDLASGEVTAYMRRATRGSEVVYIRDTVTYPRASADGKFRCALDRLAPRSFDRAAHVPADSEPNVSRPYLKYLRDRTSQIDVRGLGQGVASVHSIDGDNMYISLSGRPAYAHNEEDSEGSESLVTLEQAVDLQHLTMIVGDPGFGKSTFLRRLANLSARNQLGENSFHADVAGERLTSGFPLFVKLWEFSQYLSVSSAASDSLPRIATPMSPLWLPRFLAAQASEHGWNLNDAFFVQKLKSGEALVLLDGIDEVQGHQLRSRVVGIIEEVARTFAQSRVIVTSRLIDDDVASMPEFARVTIGELDDAAIARYVDRWAQHLRSKDAAGAESLRHDLLAAVHSRDEISRMARNPMMLTALCVVHWNEKKLPEQRASLYAAVIRWLLLSRENRETRLPETQARHLLSSLALSMQMSPGSRRVAVSTREAAEILAEHFDKSSPDEAIRLGELFLSQEQEDSGIVLARGSDLVFWHLTFMEYLAALALSGQSDSQQYELLATSDVVTDPQWHEVILLFCGILAGQGLEKVRRFLDRMLSVSESTPNDNHILLGLIGSILEELGSVGLKYENAELAKLADRCLATIRDSGIDIFNRVSSGRAIGILGDPRLQHGNPRANFVAIPSCSFVRGSDSGEQRERPAHLVSLDEFLIARYPVTNSEFREFVEDQGYLNPNWWSAPGWRWRLASRATQPRFWSMSAWNAPNLPVVGISWYEACAYAAWRSSDVPDAAYRLPTEAEWERAARGADPAGRKYPWGDMEPDSSANPLANFDHSGIGHTVAVGLYEGSLANAEESSDLYDLAGNVFDWCLDWFRQGYDAWPQKNPTGPQRGKQRIVRGGSWYRPARHMRCAYRGHARPSERADSIGFRLVRVPQAKIP